MSSTFTFSPPCVPAMPSVIMFRQNGQAVASERLAKRPALVEVRCTHHPWMRAYMAVFDHPYFAVTRKDGGFTIDSLPPGTYTMMVWHEGAAKPTESACPAYSCGR